MQVSNGRLEALPHPSSIASFSGKGEDLCDRWGGALTQHVDDEGRAVGKLPGLWLCFNELSQLEEHYSLSGLTPVPLSAMLLLCGEGDLIVRNPDGTIEDADPDEAEGAGAASDTAFETWWAAACPETAKPSIEGQLQKGDVILSVSELGDWFAVKASRKSAMRLQALRGMLRLLFRVFCSEPDRWDAIAGPGQAGYHVLDLVERIIRAELDATGTAPVATTPDPADVPSPQVAEPSQLQRKAGSHVTAERRIASTVSSGSAQAAKPSAPLPRGADAACQIAASAELRRNEVRTAGAERYNASAVGAVLAHTWKPSTPSSADTAIARGTGTMHAWKPTVPPPGGMDVLSMRTVPRILKRNIDVDESSTSGGASTCSVAGQTKANNLPAQAAGTGRKTKDAARTAVAADGGDRATQSFYRAGPRSCGLHAADKQQCAYCLKMVAKHGGCADESDGAWYCLNCWQSYITLHQSAAAYSLA